jgi:endonuclease/exonuclease/phosphatase family metal-dependent hydrolase
MRLRSATTNLIILLVILLLSSCEGSAAPARSGSNPSSGAEKILIASFNLQAFGPTKAAKPAVLNLLALIVRHFDIIAVQEIRDASGTAIVGLKNAVNSVGANYEYEIGPRLGRTSSKEQYAFFYNTATIEASAGAYTYDEGGVDTYEREPFIAHFKARNGNFDFTLIDIHTKPDDATAEISFLPNVMSEARTHTAEADVICLGDFNADGSYYDERSYSGTFPASTYDWLIDNSVDTTVASSSNTYDRVVTFKASEEDFAGTAGVFRYDEVFDLGTATPSDISDHYPVQAEFWTTNDSD